MRELPIQGSKAQMTSCDQIRAMLLVKGNPLHLTQKLQSMKNLHSQDISTYLKNPITSYIYKNIPFYIPQNRTPFSLPHQVNLLPWLLQFLQTYGARSQPWNQSIQMMRGICGADSGAEPLEPVFAKCAAWTAWTSPLL